MIHFIPDVLDSSTLAVLRSRLEGAVFVDGKATASGIAAEGKYNEQLLEDPGPTDPSPTAAKIVEQALLNSERFRDITLVRQMREPMIARYTEGMTYGPHLDAPILRGNQQLRADLSITVFLSDPSEYAGGELTIFQGAAEERVKLPAGHVVIYPADTLHGVQPVTSGMRLVAVCWVQSHIRDLQLRTVLTDLGNVTKYLSEQPPGEELTQALYLVSKSRNNLLRKFAEF